MIPDSWGRRVRKLAEIRLDPQVAFATFEDGLRNALKFPKEEFGRRFSEIQRNRAKDRSMEGQAKRGRKAAQKIFG